MAGLVKRPNSNFWIQFVANDSSRKTLRLGICTKRVAEQHQRAVEKILANQAAGLAMEQELAKFIGGLSDTLKDRYRRLGLLPGGYTKPVERLGGYLKSYLDPRRPEVKEGTWIFYQHTWNRLIEFFGENRLLSSITAADARSFRTWMETSNKRDKPKDGSPPKPLAINTIRRRTGFCRQIFRQAMEDGLIARNPFAGLPASVRSNKERQHYVPMEVVDKLLAVAGSTRWRVLLLLARHAGLRMPSELANLKWEHIDWENGFLTVADSPKTAHHANRAKRLVPMSPQLVTELAALREENGVKEGKIFPEVVTTTNLRSGFLSLIKKAGVQPWPKVVQSLRASCASDFARTLAPHIAAAICGHTQQIAQEHYWMVSTSDLKGAGLVFSGAGKGEASPEVKTEPVGGGEEKPEAEKCCKMQHENAPENCETSKTLEKPGFEGEKEGAQWAILDSNQ